MDIGRIQPRGLHAQNYQNVITTRFHNCKCRTHARGGFRNREKGGQEGWGTINTGSFSLLCSMPAISFLSASAMNKWRAEVGARDRRTGSLLMP